MLKTKIILQKAKKHKYWHSFSIIKQNNRRKYLLILFLKKDLEKRNVNKWMTSKLNSKKKNKCFILKFIKWVIPTRVFYKCISWAEQWLKPCSLKKNSESAVLGSTPLSLYHFVWWMTVNIRFTLLMNNILTNSVQIEK